MIAQTQRNFSLFQRDPFVRGWVIQLFRKSLQPAVPLMVQGNQEPLQTPDVFPRPLGNLILDDFERHERFSV